MSYYNLIKLAGSGYILTRKEVVSDPEFKELSPEERKEVLSEYRDQRIAQNQMRRMEAQEKSRLIKELGQDGYNDLLEKQRQERFPPRDKYGYPLQKNEDLARTARNATILTGLASAGTLAHAIKNKSTPAAVLGTGLGALSLIPASIARKANQNVKAGKIYYE